MITASHLPYYYNGFKFFTEDGGCEKEDIKNILAIACKQDFKYSDIKGKVSKVDFIEEYSNILINLIRQGINSNINYDKPLLGFKIVIDAGNGAGGCRGWFLLRLSLHEPMLPLNVESDVRGGVQIILGRLKPFLKTYDKLDQSCLR